MNEPCPGGGPAVDGAPPDGSGARTCTECGAPVPAAGACRDHFHALLALEWEVPGGPGEDVHFYAVAAYQIQHPIASNVAVPALDGLVATLRDVLDGRASIADARLRARAGAAAAGRVTRREGDAVPPKRVATWPIVVTDVLEGGVAGYRERVVRWARAVVDAVDAAAAP